MDDLSREQVVARRIRSQSVIGLLLLLLLLPGTINFDRDLARPLVHPCQTVINVSKDRYLLWSRPSSPPPSRHPRTPFASPTLPLLFTLLHTYTSSPLFPGPPVPLLPSRPTLVGPFNHPLASVYLAQSSPLDRLPSSQSVSRFLHVFDSTSALSFSAFYSLFSLSFCGWWSNSIDRYRYTFAICNEFSRSALIIVHK